MEFKLIRHATTVIQMGGICLLVDPMLSPKGALAPVPKSPRMRPNPLVELPMEDEKLDGWLRSMDAVLVTHTHRDHFDDEAGRRIPKGMPIICQPEDEDKFIRLGFTEVHPVIEEWVWKGITISRTGGQHGTGVIGARMAPVSGFVLQTEKEPTVYIAGDTVWCPEVKKALTAFHPDVIVVNAGAARFLLGGRITMSGCDISRVAQQLPLAKIVAVHMEAFNHCLLTRQKLRDFTDQKVWSDFVYTPNDGESISFLYENP